MRKTWSVLPILWLAMLLLPGAARAQQVLFSTLGPNETNGLISFYQFGYQGAPIYTPFVVDAVAFTLPLGPFTGSYAFSRLDLPIGELSYGADGNGQPPYFFKVQLTADASGVPGTVLETWTVSSPTSTPPAGIFTVYDTLHLELVAEHQYWVTVGALNSLTSGFWSASSQSGPGAESIDGGVWNTFHSSPPSLSVWGTPVNYFLAPIGLVESQILRLLVAGYLSPSAGGPVKANLGFLDLNGKAIGRTLPVTINPGEIVSLEFAAKDYTKQPGQRIEVVPVITPLENPNAAPRGRIQASVEVRDATPGSGAIFTSVPTSPPDPLGPALSPQSLARGQTMLINVLALPNHPCVATLNFADKKGRLLRSSKAVEVPQGTGVSFDLNADTLNLKLGERIDVRPIVTLTPPATSPTAASPRIDSACQASVEVFNQQSGRTETYQAARVQSSAAR